MYVLFIVVKQIVFIFDFNFNLFQCNSKIADEKSCKGTSIKVMWVLLDKFCYKNAQAFDFSIVLVIYWRGLPHVVILDLNKTQIETKNNQDLFRCSPKLSYIQLM